MIQGIDSKLVNVYKVSMYAKLMSRITESSLMEESIPTRYTFMMMLAIADPLGYVVGTDVAIARRLNMEFEEFMACLNELMQPDPDSNSKEHDGRRVTLSDCERGYFLVNYAKYRDTRDEEQRREYMRNYMQKRRSVNNGKQCKPQLANAEVEGDAEVEVEVSEEAKEEAEPLLLEPEQRQLNRLIPFNELFVTPSLQDLLTKDGFGEAWREYVANRKDLRKLTPRAAKMLLNKLVQKPDKAAACLLKCIEQSWTGFDWKYFEDKPRNGSQPQERPKAPIYDLETARQANRRPRP